METVRDWVIILASVIYILILLVIAGAFFFLWRLTRKYTKMGNRLFLEKTRPLIATAHTKVMVARDLSSRLPGNTPIIEGEARVVTPLPKLKMPFPRKKRKILGIKMG